MIALTLEDEFTGSFLEITKLSVHARIIMLALEFILLKILRKSQAESEFFSR